MNVQILLVLAAAVCSFGAAGFLFFTGIPASGAAQAIAGIAGLFSLVSFFLSLRSRRPAGLPAERNGAGQRIRNFEDDLFQAKERVKELEATVSLDEERLEKTETTVLSLADRVLTDALIMLPLSDSIMKAVPVKTEEAAFVLMEKFLVVREASGRASASARSLNTELEDNRSVKSIYFTAENSRKAVRDEREAIKGLSLSTKENKEHLQAMSREIEAGLALLNNITEITEQSKLIAFNMSIEAARMGEKGRGVKVITAELHKLNDRTFDFSHQVATLLGRFKDYNTLLVTNMEEKAGVVVSQVEKGIDAAEAAVESLISASSHTEAFTKEIAVMSEDINQGLDGVLESLQFQDITRQMIEGGLAILKELKKSLDACLVENNILIDEKIKHERFEAMKQKLIANAKTKGEKHALTEVQL